MLSAAAIDLHRMTDRRDAPRIYVACLASYNAGRLHGEWIDADEGAEAIREAIRAMLRASPEPIAEDWAIHDHENFGGLALHEHESVGDVAEAAELIAEHGELAELAIGHFGGLGHLDEAREAIEERFSGAFADRDLWAWRLLEDSGDLARIPERLHPYLDAERYARDLELSGDFLVLDGESEVFVLWSR